MSLTKEFMFVGAIPGKKLPVVRKHPLLPSDVLLVGYAYRQGCFSFRETGRGTVDVAIYVDCSTATLTKADIYHPEISGDPYPVRVGV